MSLGADAAELRGGSPWDLQTQAWVDAPLGWSDQLMVSASGTPGAQGDQRSRRHSLYVQWSLPWGRHLLLWSASSARVGREHPGTWWRLQPRQAAEYAAYAAVYRHGGYGATSDPESFAPEWEWQAAQLMKLLNAQGSRPSGA